MNVKRFFGRTNKEALANLAIILEQATTPIIVDAGVGTASDAALAMELRARAWLGLGVYAVEQWAPIDLPRVLVTCGRWRAIPGP